MINWLMYLLQHEMIMMLILQQKENVYIYSFDSEWIFGKIYPPPIKSLFIIAKLDVYWSWLTADGGWKEMGGVISVGKVNRLTTIITSPLVEVANRQKNQDTIFWVFHIVDDFHPNFRNIYPFFSEVFKRHPRFCLENGVCKVQCVRFSLC